MGEVTGIKWCDHTFNPWMGCTKVSPACDDCYAVRQTARLHVEWGNEAERRVTSDNYWKDPLAWDRKAAAAGVRRRVFCASLADVFEDRDELGPLRARLWNLVERTPNLDWLLLTKRPERVMEMVPMRWYVDFPDPPISAEWPKNVWIGTTAENQRYLNVRMRHLARIPAPVRFVSAEPLLGPLDLTQWIDSIDWVIVGGESGPRARPMHPQWARDIRDQCAARTIPCPNDTDGDGDCAACAHLSEAGRHPAPIPFLFKQWGEWTASVHRLAGIDRWDPDLWMNTAGETALDGDLRLALGDWQGMFKLGKKVTGDELDYRTWDEFPTPCARV